MTKTCMKNAKDIIEFEQNNDKQLSISMALTSIIVSSKGGNSIDSLIKELKDILSCDWIKDDCIEFDEFLKDQEVKPLENKK